MRAARGLYTPAYRGMPPTLIATVRLGPQACHRGWAHKCRGSALTAGRCVHRTFRGTGAAPFSQGEERGALTALGVPLVSPYATPGHLGTPTGPQGRSEHGPGAAGSVVKR